MNIHVLNLLNYVLIGFECIMAAYLVGHFFQRRYNRITHILSVSVLFGLCIGYLELLGNYTGSKLLVGTVLHIIWICFTFQAHMAKASFLALFLMSFWYVFDSLCLIGISVLIDIDYTILINSPYAYYFICFGIKAVELFGIAILCAFFKHRSKIWSMSWVDWTRILFFPTCSLVISCELMYMYHKAPDLASTLMLCACILLVADVMSVFLLDHLEKPTNSHP